MIVLIKHKSKKKKEIEAGQWTSFEEIIAEI